MESKLRSASSCFDQLSEVYELASTLAAWSEYLLLLPCELLGAFLRVLDVAIGAIGERPFELLLSLFETIERLLRLRRRAGVAACRRATHRVGRFSHLTRGVEQVR